jgi:hypothetical protein
MLTSINQGHSRPSAEHHMSGLVGNNTNMMTRVRKKIIKEKKELVVLDRAQNFMAPARTHQVRADTFLCGTLFKEKYNLKFRNKSNFVKFS